MGRRRGEATVTGDGADDRQMGQKITIDHVISSNNSCHAYDLIR
jgi:hypothetical protein